MGYLVDKMRQEIKIGNKVISNSSHTYIVAEMSGNHNMDFGRAKEIIYRASTYWLRNGSYIRLKNVELGYNIPKRFVNKLHLDRVRLYLMGTNLLTFSDFKLWEIHRIALKIPDRNKIY